MWLKKFFFLRIFIFGWRILKLLIFLRLLLSSVMKNSLLNSINGLNQESTRSLSMLLTINWLSKLRYFHFSFINNRTIPKSNGSHLTLALTTFYLKKLNRLQVRGKTYWSSSSSSNTSYSMCAHLNQNWASGLLGFHRAKFRNMLMIQNNYSSEKMH